jgi:UDP-N-acetylmuramyl tripeptide synthase
MTTAPGLRVRLASVAVRGVNWLSRVSGRGAGTVVGGRVGLRIAPDLLAQLARGRTVICVTGTNGKTTTTAMTVAGWGGPVTTNATGANMPAGHVAALAQSSHPHAVLEVDEAWLPVVVGATSPRVVVLLNLSRDQLDRANEVRQIAERWHQCLREDSGERLVVVANANDPLVVYAAEGARQVRWCDVPTAWLGDAQSCPKCTRPLFFEATSWHCTCGFAKPTRITTSLGDTLVVGEDQARLALAMPGEFNAANAAMAATAVAETGTVLADSVARINEVNAVAGRFTLRRWHGRTVRLMLAKNPAGFAAILSTVTPEHPDVVIAINARIADGRDPSWLYDVPFEQLRGHRVTCLGERRLDLATRLAYAGVDARVSDGPPPPLEGTVVPLIANYTAFADFMAETTPC